MPNEKINTLEAVYRKEWMNYLQTRNDKKMKWSHLERLHVLSQSSFKKHIFIHITMIDEAYNDKNIREFLGQLIRLFLVTPWHIFHRLPIGNIGTTRVSAFTPMEIPEDLRYLFPKQ